MASNKMNQSNPTRHLPKPMRQYLGFPNKVFLLWLALSGLALAVIHWKMPPQDTKIAEAPAKLASQQAQPNQVTPNATAQARKPSDLPAVNITVSGQTRFTLQTQANKILVDIADGQPLELVNNANGALIQTPTGQLLYRLKPRDDGQGKIYDSSGDYRYRLKCETEDGEVTCKLYDGQDTLLNRVKVKAESFNVYAAGSERIYKGKLKNGAYVLKAENGETVATLQGAGSLRDAALLSMPVEIPLRALLWLQGTR
jgi:hypothetical protein